MQIPEAIKILQSLEAQLFDPEKGQEADAMKLGIEALKFVAKYKHALLLPSQTCLPGETPE